MQREAGEGPENPIVPAISNAVWRATGIRFDDVPLSAEKVWQALFPTPASPDRKIRMPDYQFPDRLRPTTPEARRVKL